MPTFTLYLILMLAPGPTSMVMGPYDTAKECVAAARQAYKDSGAVDGLSLCYRELEV